MSLCVTGKVRDIAIAIVRCGGIDQLLEDLEQQLSPSFGEGEVGVDRFLAWAELFLEVGGPEAMRKFVNRLEHYTYDRGITAAMRARALYPAPGETAAVSLPS